MRTITLATLCLLLSACGDKPQSASTAPEADINRIKGHMAFLADDLLEGRDTGSRGHEIAAKYVASQFQQLGLQPAGTDGYMQRVPFIQAFLEQNSPSFTLTTAAGSASLAYPKDYTTSPSTLYAHAQVSGDLVFVGYGIEAPRLNHNDYANIDVAGKIVVVLTGKPASFPSEEGAHFASGSEKARYAAEHGAIGMLTISTPANEKRRPYQSRLNYIHTPRVRWLTPDGQPHGAEPALLNSAYLSIPAAQKLFADAPRSLDDIYAELELDGTPQGFALNARVDFSKDSQFKRISSPNVAAILPGTDPELKNEYVVYSAHTDHIGLAKTVEKDNINNGAMDNATGTSVLLETARLMSEGQPPKRSVLFLAVTGEEKGLLGADYFAHYPTVSKSALVANVNLDMPVLTFEASDIIAFGAEHSSLKGIVEQAAEKVGLTLGQDPWPAEAIFTRSDHYPFVKQGIPAVFVVPGMTAKDPDVDGEAKWQEFLAKHYHKPSDELNDSFNWQAAKTFTQVNLMIGQTLANTAARPVWNEGDFFGDTFAK